MEEISSNIENLLNFRNLSSSTSLKDFITSSILGIIIGYFLRTLYIKFSNAMSDRVEFGNNLPVLLFTTLLIITVVKSSLALSLGLVGALSIVRFRTAIKDPEELTFLFLSIAMGLALGASQNVIAITGFIIFFIILIFIKKYLNKSENNSNMQLIVETNVLKVDEIVKTVNRFSRKVILKRLDADKSNHIIFFIDIEYTQLNKLNETLKNQDPKISVVFMNNRIII